MSHVVAVDIGATKVSAAIVSAEGLILARRKLPVESSSVAALAQQVAKLVSQIAIEFGSSRCDLKAAGVIVPGIYFAETGNVWVPNLWGDQQVPFARELEAALVIPVRMDSDRAGCVLGEQWLGAARGVNNVVFLAIGTGIGAGIISDGRLMRGSGDVAGAVGWFALLPEHCDLYRRIGCWEAEAAGPGLARRANVSSAEQVIEAARAHDPAALQAIAETARYLGMGIANIISLLNPEVIVLGGGLMQAHDLFLDKIRTSVLRWAQPVAARQVRIEPTRLGENAGLLGAARLAFE
jgi:glucokinase